MVSQGSHLSVAELIGLLTSWSSVTTANGNAGGTTLIDAQLASQPSYDGLSVKMLSGGAAGQVRTIQVHSGNTLTVDRPFTDSTGAAQQIVTGTSFVILSSSSGDIPSPEEGLSYYGVVDAVPGANQFTIGGLAGLGAGKFAGATNPYQAFVLRDAGGASAAPQGELLAITAYVTATGVFTTAAFTAAVAVGDEILIIHPSLAGVVAILADLLVPGIDSVDNILERDVIGNKADTIPAMNLAPSATDSLDRHVKAILERLGATPADPDDSLLTSVGQRDAAATLDDLTDITTTDIQAKLRRILLRMSGAGIFSATIQGAARTELDTMLEQLATYFVAVGAAMSVQINGNAARTNLQQVWQDFSAVFGADGVNVFNPTIQGAARTDLDTALNILATYLTAAGAAMSIQVNGLAARTNLEQAFEDLTAVLGADGANIFNPTIQGAGQTDLDAALAQLAIYFAAAGAAMSVQVNGGAARANLELILEDYFAVVGCDGANIFSTTIQGVARTTIEAAFDGVAAYFVAAGAALSVTIDPGGAARTSLATLWNDLGQMLAGAAGITTWPVRAKAANTISLAEAIRDIDELKPEWAARTSATHTTAGATEETILTTAYTTPGLFYFNLTLRNMIAGDDFTIRVYKRVDGVNYDLKSEQQFVGNPTIKIYQIEGEYSDGTEFIRVTIQRTSGTNRAFPYSYNYLRQPVV